MSDYSGWETDDPIIPPEEFNVPEVEDANDVEKWVASWYESITSPEARRKMVVNYIDGITTDEVEKAEIKEFVRENVDI